MRRAEKRALIIAALKENSNATQVAREIGDAQPKTVRRIAKAMGIELINGRAKRGRRMPPERRAQIVDALRENPNAAQVARELGDVSRMTVWKIAKAVGINLDRMRSERRAQIVDALNENPNAAQVARELGDVSRKTVLKIAKAVGIKLTRRPPAGRAQIVDALSENPNAAQVARALGNVSRKTVWKIAKAAGINLNRARQTSAQIQHVTKVALKPH